VEISHAVAARHSTRKKTDILIVRANKVVFLAVTDTENIW